MAAAPIVTGAELGAELGAFAAAVTEADGVAPFNEATLLNPGERRARVIRDERGDIVALALSRKLIGGGEEAELAVAPAARGLGLGRELVDRIRAGGPAVFWAHGNLPAAQQLAAAAGLRAERSLYSVARPLTDADLVAPALPHAVRIRPFNAAMDAQNWVALNARIFANHPEQGALTEADLAERMAQPWFSAENFLILEGAGGLLLGYNWLKVTADEGEIYVIGVSPEATGSGFGRALMTAGLARLRELGTAEAQLYVDGENTRARELYRKLGFRERSVDVQYRARAARRTDR